MSAAAPDIPRLTLRGQRLCAGCFYNLRHQPIQHDKELHLWIVRCPECGQAAALGTYPALGRFERTLARLLAGAWVILIVALGILSMLALFGAAISAGYSAPAYEWNSMGTVTVDRMSPVAWVMIAVAAVLGGLMGLLWRIILLRSRGILQRIVPFAIVIAALALTWQEASSWFRYGGMWNEGLREVGASVVVGAAGAMVIALVFGSVIGLPTARWCYRRLILPERLQLMLPF